MRVLSKKMTVLVVAGLFAVLLMAGCDSGLQDSSEVTSLEINGWSLSSPEGNDAITSRSATKVTAQKEMENNGSLYNCTVTGNLDSVLDRVNDPLFGFGEVDYTDERVQSYLESFSMKSVTDIQKMHLDVALTPKEGPVNNMRFTDPRYLTISSGMDPLTFGVACSKIYCQVTPISANMRFAFGYEFCSVGGNTWIKIDSSPSVGEITTAMGSTTVNSKGVFGWWKWRLNLAVYSGGDALFGFDWYGAVPL